jgi:ubiquinone biosynthesis protein
MAGVFSQGKRDLVRLTQIMDILIKYQLGEVVDKVRIGEKLPLHLRRQKPNEVKKYKTQEERIREMFEELGTTFVKLGQLLSTRGDIIGPTYAAELSKLQDHMKPFPPEESKHIIEEELGKPVSKIFSSFESEPMASASIAQVHRAVLNDGSKVVVKVQRPGIEQTIREDLRIMHYLAKMADKYVPESRRYDPKYLVDEFERSILKELNFLRESRNALHLRENFKDYKGIYVPRIYDNLSTRRVLVMEEVHGTDLSEVIKSRTKKFNKTLIAKRTADAFFKMVMEDGFYHADLHPGNIIILDRNIISFIDYGRMDTIDKYVAENIFHLATLAINNDSRGIVGHLVRTDMLSEGSDVEALKADLTDLLEAYYTNKVSKVELGNIMSDLLALMDRYNFNRPRELAELTRAFLLLEGTGMQLDPDFSVAEEFLEYTKRTRSGKVSLKDLQSSVGTNLVDIEYTLRSLPTIIGKLLKRLGDGTIRVELEHKDLAVLVRDIEQVGTSLSISLIIAAVIIGSSLIVPTHPLLAEPVFVISVAIGVIWALKTMLFKP